MARSNNMTGRIIRLLHFILFFNFVNRPNSTCLVSSSNLFTNQRSNHIENLQNVIVVHCNQGKGRTGTIIVSMLLFSGLFNDVDKALKFYAQKRFEAEGYGVTQPCQIRYVRYFHQLLEHKSIQLNTYKMTRIELSGHHSLEELRCILKLVRSKETIVRSKPLNNNVILISQTNMLLGDIFLELVHEGIFGTKQIMRINFNTIFINPQNRQLIFKSHQISPDKLLKKNKGAIQQNFRLTLYFDRYCYCNDLITKRTTSQKSLQQSDKQLGQASQTKKPENDMKRIKLREDIERESKVMLCRCGSMMEAEKMYWEKIYLILNLYEPLKFQEAVKLLYGCGVNEVGSQLDGI